MITAFSKQRHSAAARQEGTQQYGTTRHVGAALLALFTAFFLILGAVPTFLATTASAAERQVLQCFDLENGDYTCSEPLLHQLITDAGTTPTRIELGDGDVELTSTLTIPTGADIELVNHPAAPWGESDSRIIRADGFRGLLIAVQPDAELTLSRHADGGSLTVHSRGEWVNDTSYLLDVRGAATINDGVTLTGMRNMNYSERGAVSVRGAGARLTMNGGAITDNWQKQLSWDGSGQYAAGNVAVIEGAHFEMNGGEISKGKGSSDNPRDTYWEVGGVAIFSGASMVMNGGTITENTGSIGGVFVANNQTYYTPRLLGPEIRSSFTMNGGTISNNFGAFSGGGIFILANAEATMNDGLITGNRSAKGGGVGTLDQYVWGADGTYAEIDGTGREEGFTKEEWTELSPAGFTMNGGTISGNSVTDTGGGVNIISNAVHLNGGEISGNSARGQGGGVYVATKTYMTEMTSVFISENTSTYVGGGVWTCPTGELEFRSGSDGAIVRNTAETFGDDVAHDNLGSVGSINMWLANTILGGSPAQWFYDRGNVPEGQEGVPQTIRNQKINTTGLRAEVSDAAVARANTNAKLRITGNTAPRGAGIGTNGTVKIGDALMDLQVIKYWQYEDGAAADAKDITASEIKLDLYQVVDGAATKIDQVTLDAAGGWRATISGLPTEIGDFDADYRFVEFVDGEEVQRGETVGDLMEIVNVVEPQPEPEPEPEPEPDQPEEGVDPKDPEDETTDEEDNEEDPDQEEGVSPNTPAGPKPETDNSKPSRNAQAPKLLARTGADGVLIAGGVALVLTAVGGVLLGTRRRTVIDK